MREYNEAWYTSEDGLRLFARDYICLDQSSASDLTVVCLPGLTRNSADFHSLAVHLRQHHQVFALDLRGRGRSDWDSNPANYNPGVYLRDLQNFVQAKTLRKVVLVGTSLGGLISMLTASTQPSWLQGIIINDFGPELDQAGLDRIKSYVGKSAPVENWEQAVEQNRSVNGTALPDLDESQWLQFTRNLYREDDHGRPVLNYDPAIAVPFETAPATFDAAPLWAAYDALPAIPVLLLRGELSDLLSTVCAEEMCRRRPSLLCTEVPNRGHAPLLDEPASLGAIDAFLEKLRQSQAEATA
jgi:pimeloyl-ACP methyl ester carboxylesterase